jgi:integrase/recombinase XerC
LSGDERMPGAAGLQLADDQALLRPEKQAFTAMLDGWAARQAAWCLALSVGRSTVSACDE